MLESKWGLRFVALILAVFFLSVNNVFGNIFNTDDLSQNHPKLFKMCPLMLSIIVKTYM